MPILMPGIWLITTLGECSWTK